MRYCIIKLFDKISGANIMADSAVLTLGIVNTCKIVVYMYCAVRTLLFTQLASHTTRFAELACNSTLFYIVAGNGKSCRIRDHNYHVLGASGFTRFTALAFLTVNHSNTVDNVDGIEFTCFYAVAMTQTAVGAIVHTVTEGGIICGAIVKAVIIILSCCAVSACTTNECYHTLTVFGRNAHYRCNLFGCFGTTGSAFVAGCAAVYNRFSVIGAARKSAAAAIGTGQHFKYCFLTGVAFYGKNL